MKNDIMSWPITPEVLSLISVIASATVSWMIILFVRYQFSPGLQLRVEAKWIDTERIILRMEVENKSQVRVEPKHIKLQILEYRAVRKSLSEWVPFASDRVHAGEDPNSWRDPIKIFETTRYIYPGERLAIERMEPFSKDVLLHVGLQFTSKSLIPCLRFRFLGYKEQWTTTAIFVHQGTEKSLNARG